MWKVFSTHFHISVLLALMQLFIANALSSPAVAILLLSFMSFCNLFCLAERFWDLQLNSMIYWPSYCQCMFMVSRLLLVTIGIIVSLLWVRVGWALVLEHFLLQQ